MAPELIEKTQRLIPKMAVPYEANADIPLGG
jgi:hypothetical protein